MPWIGPIQVSLGFAGFGFALALVEMLEVHDVELACSFEPPLPPNEEYPAFLFLHGAQATVVAKMVVL